MKEKIIKIYDGSNYCGIGACPIVEYFPNKKSVKVSDPKKPRNGKFTMSVEEYNNLLKNAKIVQK